jgi:hypothetical protein
MVVSVFSHCRTAVSLSRFVLHLEKKVEVSMDLPEKKNWAPTEMEYGGNGLRILAKSK